MFVVNVSGEETFMDGYATTTDPPMSWPCLQDTTEANVWDQHAAATEDIWVVGADGLVAARFMSKDGTALDLTEPAGYLALKALLDGLLE